jgi:uncharacterized protein
MEGIEKKEIYVQRDLEEKILKYIKTREIIAVIGARQSGKTTLLKKIFNGLQTDKKNFINFEDREILGLFTNDIKSFAELYVKDNEFLFIDEFQYAKQGGKNLKFLFDNYKTKIFISGSSATELSIQSIKYLVGRIFVFTLFPFSFSEYLKYKDNKLFSIFAKSKNPSKEIITKINKVYEEFLIYGGYPRVVIASNENEKQLVLKNIYNTYILKEIREILNFKEEDKLINLIKALALQVGGAIKYDELSRTTGFNYNDLKQSLSLLNKTFITCESKPFHKNQRIEIVKTPKIFFIDNGFRNTIIKDFRKIENRTDLGVLNENFVASEISKKEIELRYWKTKSNAEIDFIVKTKGSLFPIESKSRITKPIISKPIYSFIEKYSPKEVFIASSNFFNEKKEKQTRIKFVPHWYLKFS